jgi:hypothetical protein
MADPFSLEWVFPLALTDGLGRRFLTLAGFPQSYPLCEKARVVQIA